MIKCLHRVFSQHALGVEGRTCHARVVYRTFHPMRFSRIGEDHPSFACPVPEIESSKKRFLTLDFLESGLRRQETARNSYDATQCAGQNGKPTLSSRWWPKRFALTKELEVEPMLRAGNPYQLWMERDFIG